MTDVSKPAGEFEHRNWTITRSGHANTFRIKETLPSKKNSYRVRFSRQFWTAVMRIAPHVNMKKAYWIGPSKAVEQAELIIAWIAKSEIKIELTGPVEVIIVTGTNHDFDNLQGVIFDGLEKSGRIKNDQQIAACSVFRVKGRKGVYVKVEEI